MYLLTDALRVYSALDDAALMRSRSQVQRRQARGSASSALLWKPSARLRVRRRASSWSSRRRGPIRGEFDVGGGASMEASAHSGRLPPSTKSGPTQDTVDSRAVDCVLVENFRAGQEARVGLPRSKDLHPSRMPTEPSESESELTGERQPGDGGGSHEHIRHGREHNPRRGTQPENNPEKKELLMVGVPRRHSARLLLIMLVMVGVPRKQSP